MDRHHPAQAPAPAQAAQALAGEPAPLRQALAREPARLRHQALAQATVPAQELSAGETAAALGHLHRHQHHRCLLYPCLCLCPCPCLGLGQQPCAGPLPIRLFVLLRHVCISPVWHLRENAHRNCL